MSLVRRLGRTFPDGVFAVAVACVLALALWLRVNDIGANPPGLVGDEVAGAVAAWQIATTGRDLERTWLPFLVVERESMKQPIYGFSTVPAQALLGRTVEAVRLPAVLFGVVSTALVMWLALLLRGSRLEAAAAGALFATAPWAVHYGRIGWETASFLPFTLGGIGLLWYGLERRRPPLTALAVLVLALGSYTYQAALFMHVVLGGLVLAVRHRSLRRAEAAAVAAGGVAGLALLLPYLKALAEEPLMTARLKSIWVFRDGYDAAGLAHLAANFGAQWDFTWLLGEGHWNLHYGPGIPLLLWPTIPLAAVGLLTLLARRRPSAVSVLLPLWLLVGQLPGALTDFPPNFSRGLAALPALCIIAAIGARWLWERLAESAPRIAFAGALALLTIVQAADLYGEYFTGYPVRAERFFSYGFEELVRTTAETVAAGATVCAPKLYADEWPFRHRVRFALDAEPPFQLLVADADPRCRQPGAYLMSYAQDAPAGTERIAVISSETAEHYALYLVR
ncbi:MAG: ArnT family glycosyltransferase [Candidatus Limnocylindria bacterium]